jgi:glycosyltransferase involved in cell wall biosynthesis
LRIGIDAQFAAYQLRGIGKYILHLVAGLPNAGPQHDYVVYGPEKAFPSVSGRSNVRFRSPGSLPYPVWEQCLLPIWARQDKLDLLHCPGNTMPLLLSQGIKLVVTIHDVMYLLSSDVVPATTVWRQRLGNLYRQQVVPYVPRRAALILTVSEFSKSQIISVLGADERKIRVAYNGVEPPQDCNASVDDGILPDCFGGRILSSPYLLALGAHDPRKNTEAVIRSYAFLRDRHAVTEKLVIVGLKEWRTSKLFCLAEELNLQNDVYFADYIPEQELHRLYKGARCFLFLSRFEGFGFPVVEAMSRGVPVIASAVSCIPEIMGDAGFPVDPSSLPQICDATLLVLRNADLRRRLSERGKVRAIEFRWETLVRTTLTAYEDAFTISQSPSSAVQTA